MFDLPLALHSLGPSHVVTFWWNLPAPSWSRPLGQLVLPPCCDFWVEPSTQRGLWGRIPVAAFGTVPPQSPRLSQPSHPDFWPGRPHCPPPIRKVLLRKRSTVTFSVRKRHGVDMLGCSLPRHLRSAMRAYEVMPFGTATNRSSDATIRTCQGQDDGS